MQNAIAFIIDMNKTFIDSDSFEKINEKTKAYKDGVRFVRKYNQRFPVYLVSRAPQKVVDGVTRRLGIYDMFSACYGTNNYRTKENYVDVRSEGYDTIYLFGDEPADMRIFKNTKMRSQNRVAVAVVRPDNSHRPIRFIQAGADHVVESFDEADDRIEEELAKLRA